MSRMGDELKSHAKGTSPRFPLSSRNRGTMALLLHPGHQLNWVDETQGDQKPDQSRRHVNDGHRVDGLASANPGSEYCVIERDDQGLTVGTCGQESQFEHRYRSHQNQKAR